MKTQWTSTIRLRVRFPRKQAPVPFLGDAPVFPLFCVSRVWLFDIIMVCPAATWMAGWGGQQLFVAQHWLALPCLVLSCPRKQNVTLNKYFQATLQKMNSNVKLVKTTIFKYWCQLVWKSKSQASFCYFFLQWLLFSQERYHKPAYHKCLTVLLGIHMLLICLFFGQCSNIDWRASRFIPIAHSILGEITASW